MNDIDRRLQYLEDCQALQDAFLEYLAAVDTLSEADRVSACFTEDAVLDLTGLNMPRCDGHASIRQLFVERCAPLSHLAHFMTNFRVARIDGNDAQCQAKVIAISQSRAGEEGLLFVQYEILYVRSAGAWKSRAFVERALMPLIPRSTAAAERAQRADADFNAKR